MAGARDRKSKVEKKTQRQDCKKRSAYGDVLINQSINYLNASIAQLIKIYSHKTQRRRIRSVFSNKKKKLKNAI